MMDRFPNRIIPFGNGLPGEYFPVSKPCAKGLYAMIVTPSSTHASIRPDFSGYDAITILATSENEAEEIASKKDIDPYYNFYIERASAIELKDKGRKVFI